MFKNFYVYNETSRLAVTKYLTFKCKSCNFLQKAKLAALETVSFLNARECMLQLLIVFWLENDAVFGP